MTGFEFEQLAPELRDFLRPMFHRDLLDQKIVDVLVRKSNNDGIAHISQGDIARAAGTTQPQISIHIRRLVKHGHLEVPDRGQYRVLQPDVINHGATRAVLTYLNECTEHPEILDLPMREQSERIGLTFNQIQMAQGYISTFHASDTP